jgi:hypothetical protein
MVDRWPGQAARDTLYRVCDRLAAADWEEELLLDRFDQTPYCRIDPEGQQLFDAWYGDLMRELRSPAAPEGRLATRLGKYPGFVSRLLLVFHLTEWAAGRSSAQLVDGRVVEQVLKLARNYWRFMDERVHAAFGTPPAAVAGRRVARWLTAEHVTQLTARDVYRHQWSECPSLEQVEPALQWLAAHRWLRETDRPVRPGRPSNVLLVNPRVRELDRERC